MSFPIAEIAGLLAGSGATSGIVAEVRADGTVLIASRTGGQIVRGAGLSVGDTVTIAAGVAIIAPAAGRSYPV